MSKIKTITFKEYEKRVKNLKKIPKNKGPAKILNFPSNTKSKILSNDKTLTVEELNIFIREA